MEQDVQDVRELLIAAMDGGDARKLKATLRVAKLNSRAPDLIAQATKKLEALEEAARQVDAAEEALLTACEAAANSGDTQALVVAISRAIDCGADQEMIDEAKATLRSRTALIGSQAAGNVMSVDDAELFLTAAAAGDDVELLEDAIAQARKAGISEHTLAEATSALEMVRELAEAKASAEESLANAIRTGNARLLEATIALAEEANVAEETLEEARAMSKLFKAAEGVET